MDTQDLHNSSADLTNSFMKFDPGSIQIDLIKWSVAHLPFPDSVRCIKNWFRDGWKESGCGESSL